MSEIEIPTAFNTFMLDVGNGHRIYVEESGNPNGLPIVSFHGGPGSRSTPEHRMRFDPKKFRIILFDQRNGGQSTPLAVNDKGSLQYNSPTAIVEDADAIRQHLGIEKWHVCGASWGSAMALFYTLTYPEHTLSLTLRALFLSQPEDWGWMASGARLFDPPAYDEAQKLFPGLDGLELVNALADRILSAPFAEALAVTRILSSLEHGLEVIEDRQEEPSKSKPDEMILNSGLLYSHMIKHHLFETGWATNETAQGRLKNIPINIAHGRSDVSCPVKSVYDMQKAHSQAKAFIAPNAGHGVDLNGEYERLFTAALTSIV